MTAAHYDKDQLRANLDIGDLCELPNGEAEGNVICPFPHHADNDPSCNVNRRKGIFFCFGCNATGDVIDYFGYQHIGGTYDRNSGEHFTRALEEAAKYAGVQPDGTFRPSRKPQAYSGPNIANVIHKREAIERETAPRETTATTNEEKQAKLSAAWCPKASEYIASRKLDPDIARQYGAGFRARWQGADRITIPMTNPEGEIRTFVGRAIPPHPEMYTGSDGKERKIPKLAKQSKESLQVTEGRIGGWFNAPALKTEWAIYLVESYTDALALIQSGYPGAVAPIGVSLGAYDPKWFTRLGPLPRPVFICLNRDTNETGQKNATKMKAELDAALLGQLTAQIVLPPEPYNDWAQMLAEGIPIELPKPEPPTRREATPLEVDPFADDPPQRQQSSTNVNAAPYPKSTPVTPARTADRKPAEPQADKTYWPSMGVVDYPRPLNVSIAGRVRPGIVHMEPKGFDTYVWSDWIDASWDTYGKDHPKYRPLPFDTPELQAIPTANERFRAYKTHALSLDPASQ